MEDWNKVSSQKNGKKQTQNNIGAAPTENRVRYCCIFTLVNSRPLYKFSPEKCGNDVPAEQWDNKHTETITQNKSEACT